MRRNRTKGNLVISFRPPALLAVLTAVFLITKVIRTFSGVTDESGGIWNLIQILFVAAGIVWTLKYYSLVHRMSPVVILLLMNLYMLIRAIPQIDLSVSGIYNFAMIPYAAFTFILFFVMGTKKDIGEQSLLYYTFYIVTGIVVLTMTRFLLGGTKASFIKLIDVADAYFSLGLLPLAFVYVKKRNRFVPILLAFLAFILTGKRAGILALVGMILVLYLINVDKGSIGDSLKKALVLIAVGAAVYYIALYLDSYFNLRLISRLSSMGEDGGSGRLNRWKTTWEAIMHSNIFLIMFGHGWNSVTDLLGGHAHNDFLELFYNFGLIAAVLYVFFYVSLFVKLGQMLKYRYRYAPEFAAGIICSLFISNFSFYFIKANYVTCGVLCFGLFLADFRKWSTDTDLLAIQ